jgi:hypothetical protein
LFKYLLFISKCKISKNFHGYHIENLIFFKYCPQILYRDNDREHVDINLIFNLTSYHSQNSLFLSVIHVLASFWCSKGYIYYTVELNKQKLTNSTIKQIIHMMTHHIWKMSSATFYAHWKNGDNK